MKRTAFEHSLNPSNFSKTDIQRLADAIYEQLNNEVSVVLKDWDKKVSEILKKIDQHNKVLAKKGYSYFAGTIEPIDNRDAAVEYEKHKLLREHGISDSNASFRITFADNRSIVLNTPETISDEISTGKPISLDFTVYTANNKNTFRIYISTKSSLNYFKVEGEDEQKVRSTRDKLSDIFKDCKSSYQMLYRSDVKLLISLIASLLIVYSLLSIVYKLYFFQRDPKDLITFGLIIFSLGFAPLIFKVYDYLTSKFPRVRIESKKTISSQDSVWGSISLGIIINIIYDVAKIIYS